MKQRLSLWLVACALALAMPLKGQAPSVDRAVRFGDGRGIIIRYVEDLATGSAPIDVSRFRLVELETGTIVPTAPMSTFDQGACTHPPGQTDRICISLLPGAPALDRGRRYALLTDTVRLLSKQLAPAVIPVEPVSGAVQKLEREGDRILAHYAVDLGNDRTTDPRVSVNGVQVSIVTPRIGDRPLCYRRSDYAFDCQISRRVYAGDTVDVDLVARGDGQVLDAVAIQPTTVEVAVPKKREDSQLYGNWAYSRLNGGEKGSITVGIQNWPVMRFGGGADRYRLTIGPFADLIATTETNKGRYTFGPQARLLLRPFLGMPLADFRYTPRWDTDGDFRVGQLVYLDAEARLYLPFFDTGPLPRTGTRSFVPRIGIERGITMHGPDTARVEVDSPTRLKWGANAAVSWPTDALGFAPAGLRLEVDLLFRTLDARGAPARQVPDNPLYWTAQLAYGITPNVSLTLTRKSGRIPPLFLHQSAFEIGAVVIR
jgi:hypothetical protein